MKKRMLSLLLATGMVVGCLAGCGQEEKKSTETETSVQSGKVASTETVEATPEPKDPVTLEWYYRGNGQQKDSQMVEDRVNELLKEYPGLEHVSISLNCYPATEYQQQVTLAESSGEQIDILNTVSLTSWKQSVEEGSFMPITDMLSDEIKAALPEWIWELGCVDGENYIVPNYQQAGNYGYLFAPKQYVDAYDAEKLASVLTNDDSTIDEVETVMEEYLLAVREQEGDTKYLLPLSRIMLTGKGDQGYYFRAPYDVLNGNFIMDNGSSDVIFRLVGDEAKTLFASAAEWYDAGYIHPDALTINRNDLWQKNMMNPVSFVLSFNGSVGTEEYTSALYTTNWGFEVEAFKIQDETFYQNNWAAGGNGIHSTCEHPEEAMLFIEALTTGTELGKEIYNTVVYGIEGVHYTKDANDPNRIETIEYTGSQGGMETSYAGLKWILGNTFNAYMNQAVTEDSIKYAKEINEDPNAISSDLAGFTIHTDAVATQIEQVDAVVKEYSPALLDGVKGVDGWEAYYDEFVAKLEIAGYQEILDEFQRQVDEFLATK